ncbi:MAG: NUDIX hydrolase [Chloroflexi bacterium]|nr:NUDIX hydrolase [Chloroflexota bacterium]
MQHRIRAAALVVSDGRLLLVRHRHPETGSEWWVPPGGGLRDGEDIFRCAARETSEEAGISVELGPVIYLREFLDVEMQRHNLELFVLARSFQGAPNTSNLVPGDTDFQYVEEARFLSPQEMVGLTVFPEALKDEFWRDLAQGNTGVRYLGQEAGASRKP